MEPEQEGLCVNRVVRAGLAEDVISGKRHWRKSVPLKGKVTVPRGEGMTRELVQPEWSGAGRAVE